MIRRLSEDDKQRIREWTREDEDHKHYPSDWLFRDAEHTESWVLDDSVGPVLGFRVSRVCRVDIQFNPHERLRTAKALIVGFAWVLQAAKKAGFRELIFASKSKPLINFCKRRFGFEESPDELTVGL